VKNIEQIQEKYNGKKESFKNKTFKMKKIKQ
jgi:hypothetical protein